MLRQSFTALCLSACAASALAEDSLRIFERRILPILHAKNPSSCSECHLSGVDLKDYIRPSQGETFAALRNAGLIDVDKPDKSRLLEFIARAPQKPGLVTPEVRRAELEAFRAWITAAVTDPKLLAAVSDKTIGPAIPGEVIRHARQDRIVQSFTDTIWLETGRCAGCHSPALNAEQVKKHGEEMSWIVPGDAEGTLRTLVSRGLIDIQAPERSLIVAKPSMQVKHGGGQKMVMGDRSHRQFMAFVTDYAASATGQYKTSSDLPPPGDRVVASTDSWLKITGIPPEYSDMVLRVEAYPADGSGWAKTPLAVGDRGQWKERRLWQQHMSLSLARGSEQARRAATADQKDRRIPGGNYLLKIWVASEADFANGRVEVNGRRYEKTVSTQWPSGFGNMTEVAFPTSPAR